MQATKDSPILKNKIFSCKFYNEEFYYIQCGNVINHQKRNYWFNKAKESKLIPLTCNSNKAYVHKTAKIGLGSIIYPGAKNNGQCYSW